MFCGFLECCREHLQQAGAGGRWKEQQSTSTSRGLCCCRDDSGGLRDMLSSNYCFHSKQQKKQEDGCSLGRSPKNKGKENREKLMNDSWDHFFALPLSSPLSLSLFLYFLFIILFLLLPFTPVSRLVLLLPSFSSLASFLLLPSSALLSQSTSFLAFLFYSIHCSTMYVPLRRVSFFLVNTRFILLAQKNHGAIRHFCSYQLTLSALGLI